MTRYLRSIRRSRWAPPDWLDPNQGDLPADALADLHTYRNALSVWVADSPEDTDRIIIALAATRDDVQHVDFAVFDDATLADAGIVIESRSGETPDDEVNRLHCNIERLTVRQVAALAAAIARGDHERRMPGSIRDGLTDALQSGRLDANRMSDRLLADLR